FATRIPESTHLSLSAEAERGSRWGNRGSELCQCDRTENVALRISDTILGGEVIHQRGKRRRVDIGQVLDNPRQLCRLRPVVVKYEQEVTMNNDQAFARLSGQTRNSGRFGIGRTQGLERRHRSGRVMKPVSGGSEFAVVRGILNALPLHKTVLVPEARLGCLRRRRRT